MLLVVVPYTLTEFGILLLTQVLIFGLFAASLDLLVGFTGMPSLGHATYFGIGGYTAGLVAEKLTGNGPLAIIIAVVIAALVALPTGWLAVRTRGIYFLMLTLAFSQLLFSLATTWTPVTGGSNGLVGLPSPELLPGDEGQTLIDDRALYYYVLGAFLIGYWVLRRVVRSPFGRTLVGIRENEARMRSIGYGVTGYKLAAFCIAGAVGGYAGALFAQHARFVTPETAAFEQSALALIMVIIGGAGTLYGPVLGAVVVVLLRDELSTRFENWELVLGVVFVAIVYLLPRGIGGLFGAAGGRRLQQLWRRVRR